MSRLLNALLDISKLESGAIRPEITDFSVSLLFEELRREFAGLAAAKGLQLTIEPCMERVHTDASLVGQVLRNLVSNAIKYTQTGWVALRFGENRERFVEEARAWLLLHLRRGLADELRARRAAVRGAVRDLVVLWRRSGGRAAPEVAGTLRL